MSNGGIRVECTTDIISMFNPGMYWSGMAESCQNDEEYEILCKAIEDAAQDTIEKAFPDCVCSNVRLVHPKEYNYTDDSIEFDLTMTTEKFEKLKRKSHEEKFFEWCQAKWHSYSGFTCTMPTEKGKFFNALEHQGRRYEFDQAAQMMLCYWDVRERLADNKTNKLFWQRVVTFAEREGLNLFRDE